MYSKVPINGERDLMIIALGIGELASSFEIDVVSCSDCILRGSYI